MFLLGIIVGKSAAQPWIDHASEEIAKAKQAQAAARKVQEEASSCIEQAKGVHDEYKSWMEKPSGKWDLVIDSVMKMGCSNLLFYCELKGRGIATEIHSATNVTMHPAQLVPVPDDESHDVRPTRAKEQTL